MARALPRAVNSILVRLLVTLVIIYRHSFALLFPPACRYTPTCSQYALDALRKYGAVSGSYRAGKRILRCHPYSTRSGFDPA